MQAYHQLLQQLVACAPVSTDIPAVNRAMDILHAFLKQAGLFCSCEHDADGRNILYAATVPGQTADVLLNAHVDVVPAQPEQFTLRQEGDRVYGRGSADDLGSVVCIAKILTDLRGKASVGAIFTADEEIGGSTTALMDARGYRAGKLILVLDGSPYNIAIAQKGILILTLTAHGRGGHASQPWELDNPIDKLIAAYARLRQAWPADNPDDHWHNTMAACKINAGHANNQVPDSASITLNFRYVDRADKEKILAMVQTLTGLDIQEERGCEPVVNSPDHPLLQKLLQALNELYPERQPKFVKMNGATDARHLNKYGLPLAIIGIPGGGAHSQQEFLLLPELEKKAMMLCRYISSLS